VAERSLGLRDAPTDREIRHAVARFLDVKPAQAEDLVIDRTPYGDILVRPEAVFG
jgi:hypothetical protein